MIRYGEQLQVVPLVSEALSAGTSTPFINAGKYNWLTWIVGVGTCDTATTITIDCCTSNSTSGVTDVATGFYYRLSAAAAGTDSGWGAITSADSSGVALTATTDNNKTMIIDLDPAYIASDVGADYKYVRLTLTATNYSSAMSTYIAFVGEPKYAQNAMLNSTA